MKTPLERRIAARQRIVEVEGKAITLRRPTEYEKIKFSGLPVLEYLVNFVDDCPLTEADLFEGGSDAAMVFDRDVFQDWLFERPAMWKPLADALGDMIRQHEEATDTAVKN